MNARFVPGQTVQTPLGKGVILEVRNARRLLVQVQDRTVVFSPADIRPAAPAIGAPKRGRQQSEPGAATGSRQDPPRSPGRVRTLDLHGLSVEAALDTLTTALSDALLEDVSELRVVHGRSGGRVRAAVQTRLRDLPFVRAYRLDPHNAGVTIVLL
jgi:hypothetical protein